jgi:TrmH family RNA methyltransferase
MKIKRYNKNLDYSFTFGLYPTIELLKYQKSRVIKVVQHSKFSSKDGAELLSEYAKDIKIETDDKLINKLSPKGNCYIIGIFRKYEQNLEAGRNHLVLVNPSNTGNLGTILRTMLAFDKQNVAIVQPAVDIFDPKVIRSSMGALFSLNFECFSNIQEYQKKYSNKLYMFMTDGKENLRDAKFEQPYSLVFGNESSGLPQEFKELGTSVRIEQSDEVDSLNLAMSVGIVLYTATKTVNRN